MESQQIKGFIISDFNTANFATYLSNDTSPPRIEVTIGSYGQVIQDLIQSASESRQNDTDFIVVWTKPESVVESFQDVLEYREVPLDKTLKEVDAFSSLLLNLQHKTNSIFVPTWVFPTYNRGLGILDMKHKTGIANMLMHMNLRLSENLNGASNIYLLNTSRWIETTGKNAFDPKLWYMGKIAFGNEVFKEAVKDMKSGLLSILGNSKKLIVVDLDDTLWGGIVGDIGWENLNLGGHDPIGEAFVDFQNALKSFTNRGILLGIVSKNEESTALEAINKNPEMVLKSEDFSGWRINWQDKAQNIVELVSELNIGSQSVVFIDDNPVERARVREALPEVFVPEWPTNKMLYKKALLELDCFNSPTFSSEDARRTKMYVEERNRKSLMKQVSSVEEWLKTLNMQVKVEELTESNKERAVQLFNKTNQMNLSTRRMTQNELIQWLKQGNRKLWSFRVQDKFGDSGLTGIVSLDMKDNNIGQIVDFILSCRVMGRKVEKAMLYTAIKYSIGIGLKKVLARYRPTAKNKPCLDFWKSQSGFNNDNDTDTFEWDLKKNYSLPECITLIE